MLFYPKSHKTTITHGTCILTAITNDSILMVADSKESAGPKSYDVRKINRIKNIYFGISGIATIRDIDNDEFLLNISDTISDVINHCVSFNEIPQQIEERLYQSLPTIKTEAIKENKNLNEIFSGGNFIKVSIVTFINKKPEYIFGLFRITGNSFEDAQIKFYSDGKINHSFLNKNGFFDRIDSFLILNQSYLHTVNIYKLVYLVKLEVKAHHEKVSCPIDELKLTPDLHHSFKRVTCQ